MVGLLDRREAVGDYERRSTDHQAVEGFADEGFRFGVEGRSCFIQNQNARVFQERPGDGNSLALAAGRREFLFRRQSCRTASKIR